MTRYVYKGPNSGITVGEVDVMLFNGTQVELPAEDEHVMVLVHQGYLTPATANDQTQAPAEATPVAVDGDKKRK